MKYFSIFLLFCLVLISACNTETIEEKAARIHAEVLTIDTHTDTPLFFINRDFNIGDNGDARKDGSKYDLNRMVRGGLDAAFFAVFIGQGPRDEESLFKVREKTDRIFKAVHKQVDQYPDNAEIALTAADAYRLEEQNKRAIYLGLENGYPVGTDISYIEKYYNQGARYITLCHTKNNDICDSSTDPNGEEHGGLSEFGKDVVKEMNRLGMLIDVSHISDEAFYNVVELSKVPVFASHSDVRAVCDNPRNMTDDMLYKLKENRGVLQLCLLSDYVKKMPQVPVRDSAFKALRIKYNYFRDLTDEQYNKGVVEWYETNAKYPPNLASVKDLVDHLDHVVKTIGIDYVGIGSDFDGGGGLKDCYDASEFGNITLELVRRGYTEDDICKIWGGNFMRVFKEVELYANNLN